MQGSISPRRNRLLGQLSERVYQRIRPSLEPCEYQPGESLVREGANTRYLHFPVSGVVARMILDRDGESAHFGLCGDEGAVGLSGLQGSSATTALGTSLVIVRSAAYRCATSAIERELEIEELRSLVIRYFRYVLSEAMLVAFCNKRHTLQQQMCRLLLMVTDRIASAEIRTTHQIIAALVGTRREAITDMAGRLRNDGVLAYTRGALRIIDRNALLEQTCDCYLRLQARYTELAGQCAAAGTDAGAGRNVSISRCK